MSVVSGCGYYVVVDRVDPVVIVSTVPRQSQGVEWVDSLDGANQQGMEVCWGAVLARSLWNSTLVRIMTFPSTPMKTKSFTKTGNLVI